MLNGCADAHRDVVSVLALSQYHRLAGRDQSATELWRGVVDDVRLLADSLDELHEWNETLTLMYTCSIIWYMYIHVCTYMYM